MGRFLNRATRSLAPFLAVLLAMSANVRGAAAQGPGPDAGEERCLLLKYAAPGVPDGTVSRWDAGLREGIARRLSVRWVDIGEELRDERRGPAFREAGDADLARLSEMLAEVARAMEIYETEKAKSLLVRAEGEARRLRAGGRTAPFLADIFLKKGVLLHWEGDPAGAELQFGRVRVLLPDFRPDPAIFSPGVRETWEGAARKKPPDAEILVRSIPPGAEVSLAGVARGRTPLRIGIAGTSPVEIRVGSAGYRTAVWSGQWLPGDADAIDVELRHDPYSRLGEALGRGDESAASGYLGEISKACGVSRIAILVVSQEAGRQTVRVLSWNEGAAKALAAWESAADGGGEASSASAGTVADRLAASGWPQRPDGSPAGRPWYHKALPWILIGAVVIGVAAGLGGGGGGGNSGGSTGTVDVNF